MLPASKEGTDPPSNSTPDAKSVKGGDPTKCRNGLGAHETGTARTNQVASAHEMARPHPITKRRRRGSMIATTTKGMPREAHRETPESGDLVDAEVSAPREGVQGAFAAELRLRTAPPTAPIRAGSTALPSVVATVHTMSKAVAAPSPWCSTKASNVPFPRALAGGARIVASLAPLGIHSEPTAVERPTQ